MKNDEILEWVHQEFMPVSLATPDETIIQIIRNAKRYWNTHSAFPIVKMYPVLAGGFALQVSPDFKTVVRVYPARTPDWILQNYPVWSLLGITIIDNLTSDLVMLSEAYRNYRYYMGTDFHFMWQKSDNPMIGGKVYMSNLPYMTTDCAIVGTKRIMDGTAQDNFSGTSGTLTFFPLTENSVTFTNGMHIYTDDGAGALVSNVNGYSGTINYVTGAWTVTGWVVATTTGTVTYDYEEDITSEHILQWLTYYVKALVKMVEGNTLRKTGVIGITNDGDTLYKEGSEERKDLEVKLGVEGRWLTFVRKI